LGDRSGEGLDLCNLAEVEMFSGMLDEAWAHVMAGQALLDQVGDLRRTGMARALIGNLHHRAGRISEAREAHQAAEQALRAYGQGFQLAILFGHRALLECDAGDLDAARAALTEAEARVAEMNAGPDSEPAQIAARVRARLAQVEGT
jgi:ATP/maltotriose-dependent transcriptional regulator MalT